MLIVLILILGSLFMYALVVKPEIVAVIFFTITIADVNHLNVRAAIGVLLFLRILVPDKTIRYPSFFSTAGSFILMFLFYMILVTMAYDILDPVFIKIAGSTAISVITGYHFFYKKGDYTYLKISLILAGLICCADLMYTYAVVGSFPVQRIYLALLKVPVPVDEKGDFLEVINHNFYGLICGMCFVFLLNEFINKKTPSKYILLLLPVMFVGVLMSTSRSTLLGIIGISIYLIGRQLKSKENSKKAMKLITLAVGVLFISLFLFATVQQYFNLSSEFIESITSRLIDEPVAVFYKHMGLNYNAQSLDAMEWREEASSNAFGAFLDLSFIEQLFGIGFWGFVIRNLGHNNLPPHNGMLLLLIESGIIGLFFYLVLVISIIRRSLKTRVNISPLITAIIFVIIYCIGQNGELTSSITFLFFINLIAENNYNLIKDPDDEDDENESEEIDTDPDTMLQNATTGFA